MSAITACKLPKPKFYLACLHVYMVCWTMIKPSIYGPCVQWPPGCYDRNSMQGWFCTEIPCVVWPPSKRGQQLPDFHSPGLYDYAVLCQGNAHSSRPVLCTMYHVVGLCKLWTSIMQDISAYMYSVHLYTTSGVLIFQLWEWLTLSKLLIVSTKFSVLWHMHI